MHSVHGKEPCQSERLSHENEGYELSDRHLLFVAEIHRSSGSASEGLTRSDYSYRTSNAFSHRER